MLFSSIPFLYYFLPIVMVLYFAVPKCMKNGVLLLASLTFYAWGEPKYVILMIASIFVGYISGLLIEAISDLKQKKWILIASVTVCLGFLGYFKYANFFLENFTFLTGLSVPTLKIALPIGISFYTFQAVAYLCDVRKGKCSSEKTFVNFGTYLCMFPQLIAGPIVQYPIVCEQIHTRRYCFHDFVQGLQVFILGLGSKVLLANQVGSLWKQLSVIGYESITTQLAWLGLLAYTFQIYFDFWGYSLMAKGLGKMLGFELPLNFDYPYLSTSMTEFWRRWHMTLGRWFREYVYIPLGGKKKSPVRNLWIVWILTGIWHGAGWNYVLWGLFNCFLIMMEKKILYQFFKKHTVVGRLYVWFTIPLSWSLFAITNLGSWSIYIRKLFPFLGEVQGNVFAGDYIKYLKQYGWIMIIALLFCTRLPGNIYKRRGHGMLVTLFLVMIFWACVYTMYMGMEDPFLYYQF